MTKTDLVILGTGGHAREVSEAILAAIAAGERFNLLGFLDQSRDKVMLDGYPVLGDESWLTRNPRVKVVVAIGHPQRRRRVVEQMHAIEKDRFQTIIHPQSYIGKNCRIGMGAMIFAGAILTCDISVGDHAIVNTGASLSHDVRVEDFATLAPKCVLCGAVSIGMGANVGANATIIQERTIGAWAIIGAGAVVIHDIPAHATAVGNPAKVIRCNKTV